jgi:uncharacterized protein YwqG
MNTALSDASYMVVRISILEGVSAKGNGMEVCDLAPVASLSAAQANVWAVLSGAALPSLRMARAGACDPAGGVSRLGGVPLVGAGFEWPHTRAGQPLCFVGQLNSDDINAALGQDTLLAGTVLAFFYEADQQQGWGFDPGDAQYWRVILAVAATATAAPAPGGAVTFPNVALAANRVLTVPERWEPPVEDLWEIDRDAVNDIYDRLGTADRPPRHRVFGWPDLVQNPMQLECQLASNGIYVGNPEGYRDPRVTGLEAGASDWFLLWQIDTDDDAGWMWGDVGTIYYWIRRQDLAAGDFDRVWMVFQCC